MSFMVMQCNMESHSIFSENEFLVPVTQNDLGWFSFLKQIIVVKGVELMHMHKVRINASYSEGLGASLGKMTFWSQWPQTDPWPHHLMCVSCGQGTGHFDKVWSTSSFGVSAIWDFFQIIAFYQCMSWCMVHLAFVYQRYHQSAGFFPGR